MVVNNFRVIDYFNNLIRPKAILLLPERNPFTNVKFSYNFIHSFGRPHLNVKFETLSVT